MNMNNSSGMNKPMVDYRQSGYGVSSMWAEELVNRRAQMASMVDNMTNMAQGMLETQIKRYGQDIQSEDVYQGKVIPEAQAALDVVRIGYSATKTTSAI